MYNLLGERVCPSCVVPGGGAGRPEGMPHRKHCFVFAANLTTGKSAPPFVVRNRPWNASWNPGTTNDATETKTEDFVLPNPDVRGERRCVRAPDGTRHLGFLTKIARGTYPVSILISRFPAETNQRSRTSLSAQARGLDARRTRRADGSVPLAWRDTFVTQTTQ